MIAKYEPVSAAGLAVPLIFEMDIGSVVFSELSLRVN